MSPIPTRLLLVLAFLLFALPAGAQPSGVTIDGRPLPASAVIQGSDGTVLVRAPAFLRACGALIESEGGFLEAWFPGGILTLSAGSAGYQWNAMPGRLSAPVQTAPDGAMLANPSDLARILGLQETVGAGGLQFLTAGSAPVSSRADALSAAPASEAFAGPTAPPGVLTGGPAFSSPAAPPAAGAEPFSEAQGLVRVPLDTPFSPGMTYLPPPPTEADDGAPAPRAPSGANPAPVPEPLPGGPGTGPARLLLGSFSVTRDLQSGFSSFRMEAILENEGGEGLGFPVEMQFLVRGSGEDTFQVLDSDLVRTLPGGTRVTWIKGAALDPATESASPVFRVLLLSADPGQAARILGSRDASPALP